MALGVAIVIPEMITVALIFGATTGAEVHRSAGSHQRGLIFFAVKAKINLLLCMQSLHKYFFANPDETVFDIANRVHLKSQV